MKRMTVGAILGVLVPVACWAQTPLQAPEGALAFPTSAAGISAWVKVDRAIRIDETLSKVFHRIEDVSGTHILGTVKVENFVATVYPHVYVDTEGWIVAFFLASEPTAWIMHWQGDHNNPVPSIRTTLEEALERAAGAARVSLPKASFYDFRHPQANSMLILLNVLSAPATKVMYLKLPPAYTPYVASYYHYGCNYGTYRGFESTFSLDTSVMSKLRAGNALNSQAKDIPARDFVVNKLYELGIALSMWDGDNGSAGLAFVLVYRAP